MVSDFVPQAIAVSGATNVVKIFFMTPNVRVERPGTSPAGARQAR
jgi:hypothetical protein